MLNWTDEQKKRVADTIAEEVEKVRLSHKFIPEVSVGADVRSVPANRYDYEEHSLNDVETIPLVELWVGVDLTKQQAEDADLSSALVLIRRAAATIAREHDALIFRGQPGRDQRPPLPARQERQQQEHQQQEHRRPRHPRRAHASGGGQIPGLYTDREALRIEREPSYGENMVNQVAQGMAELEADGYMGPYVLVMGQSAFTEACRATRGSLVLPKDRLEQLTGGPVHRSSVLEFADILLLSLSGDPMDCAVGAPAAFEFRRIGEGDIRECRVFERLAFRLKESQSVIRLSMV
jgi:uncharacterized linocin/CFP29 family protein